MPEIEITAVGGLIKPAGDDRYRPVIRGDRINVTDEEAQRLVNDGTAVLVEDLVAENAEPEVTSSGGVDLSAMTVPELRTFANDRRIRLSGARTRPELLEVIQTSLDEEASSPAVTGSASGASEIGADAPAVGDIPLPPGAPDAGESHPPQDIGQMTPIDPDTIPADDEEGASDAG